MKKQRMEIKKITEIAKDTVEMVLTNESVAATAMPGQFLHIAVGGHTLRRPISIADIDRNQSTVTILFKIIGSGTNALASYKRGMLLDVLGPLGSGFPCEKKASALLIGGGIGVPPLYYLGKTLAAQGMEVTSILGFQTKANVFYEEKFKAFGETFIVTDDGSYGRKGLVTDLIPYVKTFDIYYSCGPIPMLQAVQRSLPDTPGYISLEERMGCGVGACFACVLPADRPDGYVKVCQHGPVFSSSEVAL